MMMARANWYSPSYSPQTGLFYQNVREQGAIYVVTEAVYEPGKRFIGASRRSILAKNRGAHFGRWMR